MYKLFKLIIKITFLLFNLFILEIHLFYNLKSIIFLSFDLDKELKQMSNQALTNLNIIVIFIESILIFLI